MEGITPTLRKDIEELAQTFRDQFSPPQFIPGCLVKSVADVNLYATNNGWIEAICGQHNQQRVRWKSAETVAVNDYIDVVHFPSRRLFEAWGKGGAGAIAGASGGNAWPKFEQNMLEGVNYSTATLLLAAMSSGDIGYLGARSSSEAVDVNVADVTLQGVGRLATVFTDAFLVSLVTALTTIEDIGVDVDGSGTAAIRITDGTVDLIHVRAEHTGVANARAFQLEAAARLYNCEGIADNTGAGTSRAVYVTNSAAVEIHGGNFTATTGTADEIFVDAGASALLNGPTLTFGNFGGAGDVFGWWLDSLGNVHIVPGTDLHFGSGSGRTLGVWLEDVSAEKRIYYSSLTAAAAAAAAGDIIRLEPGEYVLTSNLAYGAAFTIQGSDPKNCIISCATNSVTMLTLDTAGASLRNVTLNHTGAGTTTTPVEFGANNVVIENVVINLTGASSLGMALRQYGGTSGCKVINCFVNASGASSAYGFAGENATGNVEIYGGRFSGATADIYGDQAGSTLLLAGAVLANGTISWAGTLNYNQTKRVIITNANDTLRINSMSTTDFVATINGAPSGSTVTYNAPSSGAENTIVPNSVNTVGKLVLWNTTRGTSALISTVNTATNVITLTAAAPGAWASGDTITMRSQTATGAIDTNTYLYELDISGLALPSLTRNIEIAVAHLDTAPAAQHYVLIHPFQAVTGAFSVGDLVQGGGANISAFKEMVVPVRSNKICFAVHASGSGTSQIVIRVRAADLAA